MGNAPSLRSLPGSALQSCLSNVFVANPAAVSYPQDFLYQQTAVKPYNADIYTVPVAVTRPSTSAEVAEIVRCAATSGVKVQARSGGHSYGNYCVPEGAVVIDLVHFQKFEMNTTTWQATMGAGTLLGDVTKRLHDAGGRAMAHGTCPQVGIGGHATIGGLGPISRLWGSALDHVREVEVVLADSRIVRASAATNPDIFFGLKGAAASFGVITEFVVDTHPEPTSMIQYSYRITLGTHASMANTFAAWQSLISDPTLDRRLATQLIVFEGGMIISGTFFGPESDYRALGLEARLAVGNATVQVAVWEDWQGLVAHWAEDEALRVVGGISAPFYAKSLTFRPDTLIPTSTIQDLFKLFDSPNKGTPIWFAIFDLEGGATNDVPQSATAYAHRDTLFYLQTYAVGFPHVSPQTRAWLSSLSTLLQHIAPFGAYPGYVDPALKNAQEAYWGTNLPRLERLKREIDPTDLFHNPQSISPA